jgi:hypothetical protein
MAESREGWPEACASWRRKCQELDKRIAELKAENKTALELLARAVPVMLACKQHAAPSCIADVVEVNPLFMYAHKWLADHEAFLKARARLEE